MKRTMAYNKDSPAIAEFRAAIVADWNQSWETAAQVGRRFGVGRKVIERHLKAARKEGVYVRRARFTAGNLYRHHSFSDT